MPNLDNRKKLDQIRLERVCAELILQHIEEKLEPIALYSPRLTGLLKVARKNLERLTLQMIHEQNEIAELTEYETSPTDPIPFE